MSEKGKNGNGVSEGPRVKDPDFPEVAEPYQELMRRLSGTLRLLLVHRPRLPLVP